MDRLISYINHYYQDQIKSAELTEEQQKELRFLERINYDIRRKCNKKRFNIK